MVSEMPFTLFGCSLNLKYLKEKRIPFQICYGSHDLLVEPPAPLVPMKFVDAEPAEFPKGHAGILTSWSNPDSEYAFHKTFANGQRGPIRFHMDLASSDGE
jgi:hypothetical protein